MGFGHSITVCYFLSQIPGLTLLEYDYYNSNVTPFVGRLLLSYTINNLSDDGYSTPVVLTLAECPEKYSYSCTVNLQTNYITLLIIMLHY